MKGVDLKEVWKSWIRAELRHGATQGGLLAYRPQNSCFQALANDEEITKEEVWDEGIAVLLYEYRGVYLIRGILAQPELVQSVFRTSFAEPEVKRMTDWTGTSMTLSRQREKHRVEKGVFDRSHHPPEPCIAVTATPDDPSGFVVIEGNHRCRAYLADTEYAKEHTLEFFVLVVPYGMMGKACNHVQK